MSDFILSRSTRIAVDELTAAIRYAVASVEADMNSTLCAHGNENSIALVRDESLACEGYEVSVEAGQVTLAYADDLGAVYGLYDLSERYLGVTPFDFWNERSPQGVDQVAIPEGTYASPSRAVKYRGWFVNDEVMLDGWPDSESEKVDMWCRIYETILRAGGNMVIPGTDRKDDGEQLCGIALDMGLWISQHHTELLGARMFARAYPGVTASYRHHPELYEDLWQESIDRYAGQKIIWAVGYRGQGDCAFWTNESGFDTDKARGDMIVQVISRQMQLVRQRDPDALFCTNLYGEMMDLYRAGCLNVPDEVIKIWGDNGYGRMVNRRNGNDNPRVCSMPSYESGENGLYYHASFYDLQAANHTTMSPNSPQMLASELTAVARNGGNGYWNINVGSIVPHIYILDLIRKLWNDGEIDVTAHAEKYAKIYAGDASVAQLLLSYSDHTMKYGANDDDRAGDQYEHFVMRHLVRAMLGGQTHAPLVRLKWAADEGTFLGQTAHIDEVAVKTLPGWQAYIAACKQHMAALDAGGRQFVENHILLQGVLRYTGTAALHEVCECARYLDMGDAPRAYLCIHRGMLALREGIAAMEAAERGDFKHYYRNECFSNMRLSLRWLETLRAAIRICHDGENAYNWERDYLFSPGDKDVWCLTHRHNQLTDDALCDALLERGI